MAMAQPSAYDILQEKLLQSENTSFDEIKYVTHVTTKDNFEDMKRQYERDGFIHLTGSNVDGRDELSELKGLWTIVSLDINGDLHEQSPYGTRRLLIPVEQVCETPDDCQLFFDNTYHVRCGQLPTNQYIRLVLVPKSDTVAMQLCQNNLQSVALSYNPFFKIEMENEVDNWTSSVSRWDTIPPQFFYWIEYCYEQVPVPRCQIIPPQSFYWIEYCYKQVPVPRCQIIPPQFFNWIEYCYGQVPVPRCQIIPTQSFYWIEYCYEQVLVPRCQNIPPQFVYWIEYCYEQVPVPRCQNIPPQFVYWNGYCYVQVPVPLHWTQICNMQVPAVQYERRTSPPAAKSISCAVQKFCRECGEHVKECAQNCTCKCGQGQVKNCNCDPHRRWTKLKLFVEVFVVGGIRLSSLPTTDKVEITGRGKGVIAPMATPVANDSHFFAPSNLYKEDL